MTEIPRETRVLDAVVSLVDSLLDDFDVVDLLTELTEQCAHTEAKPASVAAAANRGHRAASVWMSATEIGCPVA